MQKKNYYLGMCLGEFCILHGMGRIQDPMQKQAFVCKEVKWKEGKGEGD